ncbi:magnesium transporter CorA family protein [Candidatus Saccharibacteria bacterium]|nr:magnesium transporter CorA family protein [Candidatus Saccharibacteria bacterium]
MLQYLRSTDYSPTIALQDKLSGGSWVRCEKPNEDEKQRLADLGIDVDILTDALDPHEVPRVEVDGDWTYFITRVPDVGDDFNDFTTPILFALHRKYVVTLSRDSLGRLWQPFIDTARTRTVGQTELFLHMIDTIVLQYQRRVAAINRQMRAATSNVTLLRSADIAGITEYERKLNDYLDALIPTNTAVERLLGGKLLHLSEDHKDLVEDLSIDLEQVMARCKSLLRTITNVRDSYRAVMDTKLNETIRLLTVITLTLTIPTMLAGLFGMNVPLPESHSPFTFWVIILVSVVSALLLGIYFLRKR